MASVCLQLPFSTHYIDISMVDIDNDERRSRISISHLFHKKFICFLLDYLELFYFLLIIGLASLVELSPIDNDQRYGSDVDTNGNKFVSALSRY